MKLNNYHSSIHKVFLKGIFMIICLSAFVSIKAQSYRSCSDILFANPASVSGVYTIDPDGQGPIQPFDCQCDMETDGGGWTLVLNYNHLNGTAPELQLHTIDLPLQGAISLGVDESGTPYWGHADSTIMRLLAFDEVRFYSMTNAHERKIDFKTMHPATIEYFRTGLGSTEGISTDFTPLSQHTAYLPATIDYSVKDRGNYAMTDYPLWTAGYYHWYLNGESTSCSDRWEADDYSCVQPSTFHQIWVRKHSYLGIHTRKSKYQTMNIVPNPVADRAEVYPQGIALSLYNQLQIKIFDFSGKQLSVDWKQQNDHFVIDRNNLEPGFYLCQLMDGSQIVSVAKFVVK